MRRLKALRIRRGGLTGERHQMRRRVIPLSLKVHGNPIMALTKRIFGVRIPFGEHLTVQEDAPTAAGTAQIVCRDPA